MKSLSSNLTCAKQLGDCLGKGAFGSVFRALNMGTGETVAVKQVKLADLPKSELRVITVRLQKTLRVPCMRWLIVTLSSWK